MPNESLVKTLNRSSTRRVISALRAKPINFLSDVAESRDDGGVSSKGVGK